MPHSSAGLDGAPATQLGLAGRSPSEHDPAQSVVRRPRRGGGPAGGGLLWSQVTSPQGQAAGSAAASPSESSPLGDIPDNQVYVPYSPADGSSTVTVPEGWARTDVSGGVSFTDKLNTVTVQQLTGRPQPSPDSVRRQRAGGHRRPGLQRSLGTVETRALPDGDVVHATYAADSAPDPVTGRITRDDVELYVFWRDGAEVLLTLSGPHGADDVDAWKTVSSSFAWR